LEGKAVVESIALDTPVLDLRRDRSGLMSWSFAGTGAHDARGIRLAQSTTGQSQSDTSGSLASIPPRPQGGDLIATLDRLELGEVAITNGTVTYTDEGSGQSETVHAIDATLNGRSIRDPLSFTGALTARATRFNVSADISPVRPLLEGKSADVDVKLSSVPVQATVKGALTPLGNTLFSGPVSLVVPNLDAAARLGGVSLPKAKDLGAVRVNGQLAVAGAQMTMRALKAQVGPTTVSGTAGVALNGPRPLVTADLTADRINVDRLSAAFSEVRPVAVATGPGSALRGRQPDGGSAQPQSINDLLKRDGTAPQVKGFTARDGWSEQPYDLTALSLVDVNATVRSGPVTASGVAIDNASTRIRLANGSGRITLDRLALYKGTATGVITLDQTRGGPQLGTNITAKDVTIRPLLTTLAGFSDLDGRGNVQVTVGGRGRTERALIGALQGTASVNLLDGAIIGWNIAELMRGVQQGRFDGLNKSPTQKTDFSSLTASFQIKNGIANNRDLRLTSPLLRVTGEGAIDIGNRRVDYVAKPKLVASLSGQATEADGSGITVPVRIKGSWDNPKIQPELGNLLQDPNALANQARQLSEQFKGKKGGEIVDDLLKDNGAGAKKLLKGLFGN
ncbi:MAG: AsmA family protein, partial [Pseudomonadota bacterium]